MNDKMKENTAREAISAGGLIVRIQNGIIEGLFLRDRRYEGWTLPKGHVEEGETLEQAALREIREEAGVTEATILLELGKFRRFVERAQEWKTIHYFLMTTSPDQPLGKLENEKMETRWFPIDEMPEMYLAEQKKVILENQEKIIAKIKKPLSADKG